MIVKILVTFEFYPDGSEEAKRVYFAGAEPDVTQEDAALFISKGLAKEPESGSNG
jgi:hypothetical protein